MNLLERCLRESVGDINLYKPEALTETDVTHNSLYRLDANLHILRTENIHIYLGDNS
jgi:hypothetical protein